MGSAVLFLFDGSYLLRDELGLLSSSRFKKGIYGGMLTWLFAGVKDGPPLVFEAAVLLFSL